MNSSLPPVSAVGSKGVWFNILEWASISIAISVHVALQHAVRLRGGHIPSEEMA